MDNTVKIRLLKFVSYLKIGQNQFEAAVGISNGYVNNLKDSIGSGILMKIHKAYPMLNIEWLLCEEGEMLKADLPKTKEESSVNVIHCPKCAEPFINDQMINLYDIDAAANLSTLFSQKGENVIDKLKIPNLGKCDGAVFVKGDSMYPLLKSGDIVIYKEITDLQNDIFYGEMYLIAMSVAGDEYVVVKYVNRSEIEGHIKLVSYNKYHDPKDVHLRSIRAMAIVKGSFRYNI